MMLNDFAVGPFDFDFTNENEFVEPVTYGLARAEPVAYVLAIGIIVLTALRVRRDPEMVLWALVAASLLVPLVS